jgi:hypothetical protein
VKVRSSSKQVSETYVSLKVEGTQRARSHGSRTDRWNEEFEITVDKANEVEIAVYDKQVSELHPVPIGLLWIRISDLVEAQRRQKVMMESDAGGWVTAGAMGGPNAGGMPSHMASHGDMNAPLNFVNDGMPGSAMGGYPSQNEGIEAWFAVEPAGALALQLNFGEQNALCRSDIVPLKDSHLSQGECTKAAFGWSSGSRASRSCPKTQGRGARDERP